VEEPSYNNPIPFLILATGVGYLAGSWWIGLLVGIGMTLIPGVAVLALFINNAVILVVGRAIMVLGFPFFAMYLGIRRILTGQRIDDGGR
jgi:hypothetical protein